MTESISESLQDALLERDMPPALGKLKVPVRAALDKLKNAVTKAPSFFELKTALRKAGTTYKYRPNPHPHYLVKVGGSTFTIAYTDFMKSPDLVVKGIGIQAT